MEGRLDEPDFTIGIEEEYLLVDVETRNLAVDPPPEFMRCCEELLGDRVTPEFLKCQVEVGTPVCRDVSEARSHLKRLRSTIATAARQYGLAPIAASTHPFADWYDQKNTDKARYNELAEDLQVVVRRMVICGMHVHVGIENKAVCNDLFGQLTYFLPHLLALSTSSPFWQGRRTGLKSYRLAIFDEMPRTGLPHVFESYDEYERTINTLVTAGVIEDATKVWWDLRPSNRYPTLEMRVTDVCTRIEDALSIAALYSCLARMLYRLRLRNQRWRRYSNFLIDENRWLAQRHGVAGQLIDFGRGETVPYYELIDELVELVAEDAEALGCVAEIERCRKIAAGGTSADQQIDIYNQAVQSGRSEEDAMKAVVDYLIRETIEGCNL